MKTNTRKMRKAQSATEYLMTYGWAILAIAIVGALLYTQVFQTKKCAEGAIGFPITGSVAPDGNEYSINGTGTMFMVLKNTVGKDINVSTIKNTETTGGATITLSPQVLVLDGETATISAPGFVTTGYGSGKCYSIKTTVIYQTRKADGTLNGVDIASGGTINGKYM